MSVDRLWSTVDAPAATKSRPIGVAVSGGSDSMAMLYLLALSGWNVRAVTVDHRLRAAAADEAQMVASVCAGLGVQHDTLVWDHDAIAGNLMDHARRARYRLMADWARGAGIDKVVLGHTGDDQAETFLMALGRGTGLDGLVGMRGSWVQDGVTFARPLLTVNRAELREFLAARDVAWIDDPTNADDHYTRVKARNALQALTSLGISVARLGETMRNLRMVQDMVKWALSDTVYRIGREEAGGLALNRAGFLALPAEARHRLLAYGLRWAAAAEHPPRADGIGRVELAIGMAKDATLSGCRIRVTTEEIRILREPNAVAGVECATDQLWDHRWHLDGPHAPGLTIRALGDGLRLVPGWRATGLPRNALIVTPAVWRGDALIAAPLAGFGQGWAATLRPAFVSFLLSH